VLQTPRVTTCTIASYRLQTLCNQKLSMWERINKTGSNRKLGSRNAPLFY
jgi:hypothetical protein